MNIDIIKAPRLTEKSVQLKEKYQQVTFVVSPASNKIEIKRAIEKMFKVTVSDIKTSMMRGKKRRMGRFAGKKPDRKKAVITLKEGDRITYFEGA